MTSKVKMGLFFGSAMAVVYVLENILFDKNLTTTGILKSVIAGLVAGIVAGFLFAWLMGLFMKSKFLKNTTKIEISPGETMVFQTLASHFRGIEAVGGKLYLTDKRLIFKSHKLNIQNHELIINLSSIIHVSKAKSLGLISNRLIIQTSPKEKEKFVVEKLDEWIAHLK